MVWPLLEELRPEDRREVVRIAQRRRYRRGEVVFHEGDPGNTLHLIDRGRVAVRITTPMGEVATLTVLGVGEYFGELALLAPGSRRTATVTPLEATETLTLHQEQFEQVRTRHPAVERILTRVLAQQVERLSAYVLEALYIPAEGRVVRRLAFLLDVYDGAVIPLTQEDLASMAGTSRATANRVLGDLAAAGLLEVGRSRIMVLDPDGLRQRT